MTKTALAVLFAAAAVYGADYKVLAPTTQDNLTVFPIVSDTVRDTGNFLTLDEGIRSGQVVVAEEGSAGLIRPRHPRTSIPDPWPEHTPTTPPPSSSGAEVNRLMLVNNSGRPLILLAGEIVTGGKQDRVVGKDRIVPPHSQPQRILRGAAPLGGNVGSLRFSRFVHGPAERAAESHGRKRSGTSLG